jgi:HEAT repeat protein
LEVPLAEEKFSLADARQLLEIALRNPDPELAGLAVNTALAVALSPATLLGDAVEAVAGEDISDFFHLMRRYGRLDLVFKLLEDRRHRVRQTAAASLRWIRDAGVLGPLERATADPDPDVRAAATKSLESVREGGITVLRKPLSLRDVHPPDRALIGLLLGRAPGTAELPEVLGVLNSPALSANMRQAVASTAVRVFRESGARLFETLESTEHPSEELIATLGELGDARAVPYLLRHAGCGRQDTLPAICRALADIGGDKAARGLVALFHKSSAAPGALKKVGTAAAPYLLEAYAQDPELRTQHAGLLVEIAGPGALPALIGAIHDPDPEVRANAETGLYALGEASVEPLLKLLASGYHMPRPHAIRVLASLGDGRALGPILEIASNMESEERSVAVEALGSFAETEAVAFLEISLHSSDAGLRTRAAKALARSDHPGMTAALFRAAADANPAVRISALEALPAVAWRESSRAIAALVNAARDRDAAVAGAAKRALVSARGEGEFSPAYMGHLEDLVLESRVVRYGDPAAEPTVRPPVMPLDEVRFSAVAPNTVAPGESFLIDFWAHLEELSEGVAELSRAARGGREIRVASQGPVKLARDTFMRVRLSIPTFGVADLEDTIVWTGRFGNASFPVTAPREATAGTHLGRFTVFVGPLQISRLHFELSVAATDEAGRPRVPQSLKETRIRSAFASYATEDRDEVLARLQGMLKVLPDLNVFLDVLALRSGEKWEQRIHEEISARDIFYLFWSLAASRSHWVEREWRTALAVRGLDYIDPVPLQPPTIAPPPAELAALHFNEWTLAFRAGNRPV